MMVATPPTPPAASAVAAVAASGAGRWVWVLLPEARPAGNAAASLPSATRSQFRPLNRAPLAPCVTAPPRPPPHPPSPPPPLPTRWTPWAPLAPPSRPTPLFTRSDPTWWCRRAPPGASARAGPPLGTYTWPRRSGMGDRRAGPGFARAARLSVCLGAHWRPSPRQVSTDSSATRRRSRYVGCPLHAAGCIAIGPLGGPGLRSPAAASPSFCFC